MNREWLLTHISTNRLTPPQSELREKNGVGQGKDNAIRAGMRVPAGKLVLH